MSSCHYCAQTNTRKDSWGYCKKYRCFTMSSAEAKLNSFIQKAGDVCCIPDTWGNVSNGNSNPYRHRTRAANKILSDEKYEFGFIPIEVLEKIPMENREKWDKDVRW